MQTSLADRKPRQTPLSWINVALLGAAGASGGALLVLEGYLGFLHWPFVLYLVLVGAIALWFGAFDISTKRLGWLAAVAGVSGFATQVVGSTIQQVWVYPGPQNSYFFVPSMFVFAATVTYGLVGRVGPRLRRRLGNFPRSANLWVVAALVLVLLATSAKYHSGSEPYFWLYYGMLALFALYASLLMDLGTLLTLVAIAIVVGTASEVLGAYSGVWQFQDPTWLPPAYLVLGSWPLEIILHYGLSGILSGERLLAKPKRFKETRLFEEMRDHPMWTGNEAHRVVCAVDSDHKAALDQVIEQGGLFDVLAEREKSTGKSKEELLIALKPNLMFMYSAVDRSTFTSPELVEHLVDRMWERGYRNIKVVEAQSAYGNFFHDREVKNVARVAGYRPGERYEIVDLTEEAEPFTFTGPLGHHEVGRTWREADARISFAKNKTHTWAWYTLTIKNIYGALSKQDKIYHYHYRHEIYYPTIDMLVSFPVHFGLVDAGLSADGPFGIFADKKPNPTDTVYGGKNLLAVDWVGAQKMGLDPMVSRYMQLSVQAFGKPSVDLIGDASEYPDWRNVPKVVIDFWDAAEESYSFTNAMFSLLNHNFMGRAFRRKPIYGWRAKLTFLLGPLGGLIYRTELPTLEEPAPPLDASSDSNRGSDSR